MLESQLSLFAVVVLSLPCVIVDPQDFQAHAWIQSDFIGHSSGVSINLVSFIEIWWTASNDTYGHNTVTNVLGRIRWSPLWFSSFMLARTLRSPGADVPPTGSGEASAPGICKGGAVIGVSLPGFPVTASIVFVGIPLCAS